MSFRQVAFPQRKTLVQCRQNHPQVGWHYFTIGTVEMVSPFGTIINGHMHLNLAGEIVWGVWNAIPSHYCGVELDSFVVMPDHVHGLIYVKQSNVQVTSILHALKSISAKRIGIAMRTRTRIWQRNFHKSYVWNESSLIAIRKYIDSNPARKYSKDTSDIW
jgi:putative transposase